jgi:hypothetical protein
MIDNLARRAVACKGWRWMPGMSCAWKPPGGAGGQQIMPTWARVADLPMGPLPLTHCLVDCLEVYRGALPDLSDPATLGCLLALVREVWPGCHAEPNGAATWDGVDEAERGSWWAVYACGPHRRIAAGATEAEALVVALEAAP